MTYVVEAVDGSVPQRRFTLQEAATSVERAIEALRDVGRYAREARAGVEDAALRTRFVSPWGLSDDAEQMLEHATCHPGRHIRQLRRLQAGELS